MKKISICYIIDSLEIGGANKLTIEVIRLLNEEKFDITLFSLSDVNAFELEKLLPDYVKFQYINLKSYKGFKKIEKLSRCLQHFDIIHPVLENSTLFCSLVKIFYNRKLILVTTIHGTDSPSLIEDSLLQAYLKKTVKKKYIYFSRYLLKYTYLLFNNVIAVSNYTKNFLITKQNVSWKKIETIYHGINVEESKFYKKVRSSDEIRESFEFTKQDFVLGYIGRITFAKGLDYLIEQLKVLNGWNSNIKLLLVGEGELTEFVKQQIEKEDMNKICKISGFVQNVMDYYKAINLFILPSFSEGIPLSLLEAMLMRKITLCSDAGGITEVIINNENGFLFKKGNFYDFTNKVKYIYDNKENMKTLIENAYETVLKKFDLRTNVKKIENFLQVVNSRKP